MRKCLCLATLLTATLNFEIAQAQREPVCRTCTRPVIIYEPTSPTVVPLPAGLPLAATAIGVFLWLRRSRGS